MSEKVQIEEIEVEKLFGCYSYLLQIPVEGKFMIVYGDNGCGKTTILSFLFHLLSKSQRSIHNYAISKVVFEKFIVQLSNGDTISVIKKNPRLPDYSIRVVRERKIIIDCPFKDIEKTDYQLFELNERYSVYLDSLNLDTIYLPADRKIYENFPLEDEERRMYRKDMPRNEISKKNDSNINTVLEKFREWLITSVVRKTDVGYRSIEDLYLGAIKDAEKPIDCNFDIKKAVDDLYKKNESFEKFGLSRNFLSNEFRSKVTKMKKNSLKKITPVLKPYMDSLTLRLDALQTIQEKLNILKKYLDRFFLNKTISIDAFEGLKIISNIDKQVLDVRNLSSGERQIIYLFCRIVVASSKSSVVIIDEPEISLNIRWQKQFLKAIDEIIGGEDCLVIVASHSVDLIAPYESSVVELQNK